MPRVVKLLLRALVVLLVSVAAGLVYFFSTYPSVPPAENIQVSVTPERMARGSYLFNHVASCLDCHSQRDWTKYAGPIKPGTEGAGGHVFDDDLAGLPGDFYGRNVTPAALGTWSDGEVIRAITTGVTRDNLALFPLMPYPRYRVMDREDIESIVAYMRSLKPIENHVTERSLHFPMQFIIRTLPSAPAHAPRPPESDRVAYGRYLANAASCGDCHTQIDDRGEFVPNMEFAGGMTFRFAVGGFVRSANITPDADTGIGTWTEAQFVQTFKAHERQVPRDLTLEEQRENTVMPWTLYSGITENDLRAIYAYLRTVKPIVHRVQRHQ